MQHPAFPENEAQRLAALMRLEILDSAPEERFDRITRLAQHCFNVPIVLVSLIDHDRQWFKSKQGVDVAQTPRDISFCGHAIFGDEVFYIPNALLDERFADNPLVTGAPNIRFYAGMPLSEPDGYKIGTLCLIDSKPRTLNETELRVLCDLAACVEHELGQARLCSFALESSAKETRLRAVLNTVIDGIITIDARGSIETFNPMAEKIFGYVADEVVGRNVNMLMPEPYQREHDGYLQQYAQTHQPKVIGIGRELSGRRKDGTVFPLELAVSEMQIGGQMMFTGVVRDITERKRSEQLKSEFISTVSHELRTPLTSIRGALGLVLGKFANTLPDKAKQLLETASRNGERLTVLINDILDLEKLASGQIELEFKVLDLMVLARQAINANEGYALQHAVRLRLENGLESAYVRADENRLSQVFANLLSNAVKYSPQGGEVRVTVQERTDCYRVCVQDAGRGIPEAFRSRMFQRFSQADSSDAREKGGTGLGLSITKSIVELHDGCIDYRSEAGVGTTFFFDLPQWYEQVAWSPAVSGLPRVLICEDNQDVARVLAELLAEEGIASDHAATAAVAFERLQRCNYQALLLDLGLPDVDGLTLIQQLRQHPTTRNVSVIVVSGRKQSDLTTWNAEILPIVDWIQKPIDREHLKHVMARLIHPVGRARILHIEDDPDIVEVTRALLEDNHDYHYAASLETARQMLQTQAFDLVLLDLTLPDGSGLSLLDSLGEIPVVMFSNLDASAALQAQVAATLTKSSTNRAQLLATIRGVLSQKGVAA